MSAASTTVSKASRFTPRESRAGFTVAFLSGLFAAIIVEAAGFMYTISAAASPNGSSTLAMTLGIVAGVFIALSVYVSGVVTANTVGTVIAGKIRSLALLRLAGATATSIRGAMTRAGAVVGALGCVAGAIIGILLAWIGFTVGVQSKALPDLHYNALPAIIALPIVCIVLVQALATWVGTSPVARVRAVQALRESQTEPEKARLSQPRLVFGWLFVIGGGVLLFAGAAIGFVSPLGLLIAFFGGLVNFTGVIMTAPVVIPRVLAIFSRMLGSSRSAAIAAGNVTRHPARSSRSTLGIVIGVALVTMFLVAGQIYLGTMQIALKSQPAIYRALEPFINGTVAVFVILVGFAAVIAAIGLINNLTLSVLQRSREFGLLRAIGLAKRQVTATVTLEGVLLSAGAAVFGVLLGVVYGWCAGLSTMGSVAKTLVIPWNAGWQILIVIAVGFIIGVVASASPARWANRLSITSAVSHD